MKLLFSYFMSLFPEEKPPISSQEILKTLMHPLDDMSSSVGYYKRLARAKVEVESEAYGPWEMKLVADQGRFKGLGHRIVQISE